MRVFTDRFPCRSHMQYRFQSLIINIDTQNDPFSVEINRVLYRCVLTRGQATQHNAVVTYSNSSTRHQHSSPPREPIQPLWPKQSQRPAAAVLACLSTRLQNTVPTNPTNYTLQRPD